MKTCSRCNHPKPVDQFVKSTVTKSGFGAHCLECDRQRVSRRRDDPVVRAARRQYSTEYRFSKLETVRANDRQRMQEAQAWINGYKTDPCKDCRGSFPTCCMDFDHVRGHKVGGIGQLLGYNKERLLQEIAKCDLVCACCHRVRTHGHRSNLNPHRWKYYAKVDALKTHPCKDCGEVKHPVAMDFDHVRGSKVASISQMRSMSWGLVLVELAKCDLVCACCHRVRTQTRRLEAA